MTHKYDDSFLIVTHNMTQFSKTKEIAARVNNALFKLFR